MMVIDVNYELILLYKYKLINYSVIVLIAERNFNIFPYLRNKGRLLNAIRSAFFVANLYSLKSQVTAIKYRTVPLRFSNNHTKCKRKILRRSLTMESLLKLPNLLN